MGKKKLLLKKRAANAEIDKWNEEREDDKYNWGISNEMRRMRLSQEEPQDLYLLRKFTAEREETWSEQVKAGGLDWYRYQNILF